MDFLSANEADLEGVPDSEVLALAANQDRILVSHDFQTMPRHFGDFLQRRGSSPGMQVIAL
jgi:predicted nuclease of predicted toxin-antitoxin system